jgi:uncharacterized repeat protein (TIGR02543 family)
MPKLKKTAIILAICMVLTLMPVGAFAEGSDDTDNTRITNKTTFYQVVFDSQAGTPITGSPFSVKKGAAVTKPDDPTLDGYFFRGWYTENTTYSSKHKWDFSDPVTSNMTLYAKWAKVCTVTATPGEHGSITGLAESGVYGVGDTATLTAVPEKGYALSQWTQDGVTDPVSNKAVYSFSVTGDMALSASFAELGTTTLTVSPAGFDCIALSWTQVAGSNAYQIFRSDKAGQEGTTPFSTVYGADMLGFTDTAVSLDKEYFYTVCPICNYVSGISSGPMSSEASAITENGKPSVKASPDGYYSIKISWDSLPAAEGYKIYSASSENGNYSLLKTISSADILYYNNTGLKSGKTYYYKVTAYKGSEVSAQSEVVSALSAITAPALNAISYSNTSIRLSWNVQSGMDGYVLYRASSEKGTFKKIYTAACAQTAIYINGLSINKEKNLSEGTTYFYKIQSYHKSGSSKKYSPLSDVVSAKAGDKDHSYKETSFALYKQGDNTWEFCMDDAKNACLLTSYAIVVQNMGIDCTPKTLFESNGGNRYMTTASFNNMAKNFGVKRTVALSRSSSYLSSFDGTATVINNPKKNAAAAIKEALNRNPEGVIVYFKNTRHKHAFVACRYQGEWIYYSDPGTSWNGGGTHLVGFADTWVSREYHMKSTNLWEIIALDKIQ